MNEAESAGIHLPYVEADQCADHHRQRPDPAHSPVQPVSALSPQHDGREQQGDADRREMSPYLPGKPVPLALTTDKGRDHGKHQNNCKTAEQAIITIREN